MNRLYFCLPSGSHVSALSSQRHESGSDKLPHFIMVGKLFCFSFHSLLLQAPPFCSCLLAGALLKNKARRNEQNPPTPLRKPNSNEKIPIPSLKPPTKPRTNNSETHQKLHMLSWPDLRNFKAMIVLINTIKTTLPHHF